MVLLTGPVPGLVVLAARVERRVVGASERQQQQQRQRESVCVQLRSSATGGGTGRQTGGQSDRQTDRQTDTRPNARFHRTDTDTATDRRSPAAALGRGRTLGRAVEA